MNKTKLDAIIAALEDETRPWPTTQDWAFTPYRKHPYMTKPALFAWWALNDAKITKESDFETLFESVSKEEMEIFRGEYPLNWFGRAFMGNAEAEYVFDRKTIISTRLLFYDMCLWLNVETMATITTKTVRVIYALRDSPLHVEYLDRLKAAKWMAFTDRELKIT